MTNPNDPASDTTIRQEFVKAAMEGLVGKFTDWARNDTGTRVCPEEIDSRSREVAKLACLYADAALAEEARTRSKA